MQQNWVKQTVRALGVALFVFVSGLLIYETPPESADQFLAQAWQPSLQAVLAFLGAFGINMATRTGGVPHP